MEAAATDSTQSAIGETFPGVPKEMLAEWMKEFEAIEREIWRAAEMGGPATTSYETFKKRIRKSFPFMNEGALSHAWTLTSYYTWHEGYG